MKTKYWDGIEANVKLMKGRSSPPSPTFPHASLTAGFLSRLGVPPLYQPCVDGEPDQGRAVSAIMHHKYVRPPVTMLQATVTQM